MSPMECRSTAWGFQTGNDSELLGYPLPSYILCEFVTIQYTYVATMPLLVLFSVAMTVLKYKEGTLSVVNLSTQSSEQVFKALLWFPMATVRSVSSLLCCK